MNEPDIPLTIGIKVALVLSFLLAACCWVEMIARLGQH